MRKYCLILAFCLLIAGCGSAPADAGATKPTATAPVDTTPKYPEPDKLIALTFDDGPNQNMDLILDVLEQYDAKASFFLIGKHVDTSTSAIVKRAFDAGHEIGNHSESHTDLSALDAEGIAKDVDTLQTKVEEITGVRPVWFRAPFLSASETMYGVIDMPFAGCGVSAGDGSNDNLAEDRHYRVVSNAYDGAIALLHCNNITAGVLPQILEDLKMQGYEFVTVSELFARKGITPDTTVQFQYKDACGQ